MREHQRSVPAHSALGVSPAKKRSHNFRFWTNLTASESQLIENCRIIADVSEMIGLILMRDHARQTLHLPLLMVLLNLGAAIVCFMSGDWRRGIYWLAGGVCIVTVSL